MAKSVQCNAIFCNSFHNFGFSMTNNVIFPFSYCCHTGLTFQKKIEPTDETNLGNLSAENVESHGPSSELVSILDIGSINSFTNFVMSRTGGKGLHTFIADNVS